MSDSSMLAALAACASARSRALWCEWLPGTYCSFRKVGLSCCRSSWPSSPRGGLEASINTCTKTPRRSQQDACTGNRHQCDSPACMHAQPQHQAKTGTATASSKVRPAQACLPHLPWGSQGHDSSRCIWQHAKVVSPACVERLLIGHHAMCHADAQAQATPDEVVVLVVLRATPLHLRHGRPQLFECLALHTASRRALPHRSEAPLTLSLCSAMLLTKPMQVQLCQTAFITARLAAMLLAPHGAFVRQNYCVKQELCVSPAAAPPASPGT